MDMIEFGVENFRSLSDFEGMKKTVGSKPTLVFSGDQWSSDPKYDRIRNLFIGMVL